MFIETNILHLSRRLRIEAMCERNWTETLRRARHYRERFCGTGPDRIWIGVGR